MSNYNLPTNKAKHLKYKFGWLPDLPDARDYVYQPPLKLGSASELPSKVDLLQEDTKAENQAIVAAFRVLQRTCDDEHRDVRQRCLP